MALRRRLVSARKVRYLNYEPADRIPEKRVMDFVRHAATLARLSPTEIRALRAQHESEVAAAT